MDLLTGCEDTNACKGVIQGGEVVGEMIKINRALVYSNATQAIVSHQADLLRKI